MLLKYSAKNWPLGQGPAEPPIVNVRALDTAASELRTVTDAEPAVAMSSAPMLAVSWVALTNVVERAVPFHSSVLPATKFVPVAVRVNAGPPAAALLGDSELSVGFGAATRFQLAWATASPPRS